MQTLCQQWKILMFVGISGDRVQNSWCSPCPKPVMPHNKKHTESSGKFLHTQDNIYYIYICILYTYIYILKPGTTKPDPELQYRRKEEYLEERCRFIQISAGKRISPRKR